MNKWHRQQLRATCTVTSPAD